MKAVVNIPIAKSIEHGLVMIIYNWKGLKEENYLYTMKELEVRDFELYQCISNNSSEWCDGAFCANKTYQAKIVQSYDELICFLKGDFNDYPFASEADNDCYCENCFHDLFMSNQPFSNMMKSCLHRLQIETDYDFPTLEEVKKDYEELMEIIKDIRTIEQVRSLDMPYKFTIEVNGMSIDEFVKGNGSNSDIEWLRYEAYGCLAYIYDRFDGKPVFDIYSKQGDCEFITDITIDKLTPELYAKEKEALITILGNWKHN